MGRHLKDYHFNGLNHNSLEHYMRSLDDGLYLIKAVSDRGSQSLKFVIAK